MLNEVTECLQRSVNTSGLAALCVNTSGLTALCVNTAVSV